MFKRRPSPTTVIACLALFFAVAGGSAIALKGKNTVDSGDIKKGQVKTSDIANNAVTTKKIKGNAVRTSDIQNGQVRPGDLAPEEAFHIVGAPGEPTFGNGGEGDCIWTSARTVLANFGNPAAFYRDARGVVHVVGAVVSQDGPGGDGACDAGSATPEALEDSRIFTLPAGYRPADIGLPVIGTLSLTDSALAIIGATSDIVLQATLPIPAGAVINGLGDEQILSLDGVTFRAAGPGTGLPRRAASGTGGLQLNGSGVLGLP
jgi:hypothetical protein